MGEEDGHVQKSTNQKPCILLTCVASVKQPHTKSLNIDVNKCSCLKGPSSRAIFMPTTFHEKSQHANKIMVVVIAVRKCVEALFLSGLKYRLVILTRSRPFSDSTKYVA